jgi:hypothetical protein
MAALLFDCGVSAEPTADQGGDSLKDVIASPTPSPSGRTGNGKWQAGEFRSLKVGTDTRDKALRVLGEPVWTGDPFEEMPTGPDDRTRDEFENVDEMYGRVAVTSLKKDGRILYIEASLPNVPIEEVLARFGKNYQRKRYGSILCVEGDPDSAIMIEKEGRYSRTWYLYPELGVVVPVGFEDKVNHVQYISEPPFPDDPKCPTP